MGNGVTSFMLHAVNEFLYRYRGQACFCFMLAVCAFNAFVVVPSLLVRTDLPILPDALFDVIPHVPAVGVWTENIRMRWFMVSKAVHVSAYPRFVR